MVWKQRSMVEPKARRAYPLRVTPRNMSDEEKILYVVQGLPGVGRELSVRLMERFGTLRRLFSAAEHELAGVRGVGAKLASELHRLFNLDWRKLRKG